MKRGSLGRIRCATITSPDLLGISRLYSDALDYHVVERGEISPALAVAWGAEGVAGSRFAMLAPQGGTETVLRFVACTDAGAYVPYSCYGWNAIELVVESCDGAANRLVEHGFKLIGPPADLAFSGGALRAAQVRGVAGEVLYLTQVKRPLEGFQLPLARCPIDKVFIAVLTGSTPQFGFEAYAQHFTNASAGPFATPVPAIAQFQGVEAQHPYQVGTLALAPENYLEFDDAPAAIGPRPRREGLLPPGIAMVTFEAAGVETSRNGSNAPLRPGGSLYGSGTMHRAVGAFGEWLELLTE